MRERTTFISQFNFSTSQLNRVRLCKNCANEKDHGVPFCIKYAYIYS